MSVSTIFEDANLGAGFVLNFLLLYAIRRFSRKSLGTYKQLLTIFVAFDIFLIILHAVMKPKLVLVNTTFGIAMSSHEDRKFTSLYSACFTVPFTLMIIHFVYRFWSIRHPERIALFSNKKFIVAVSSYPVIALVLWYLLSYYVATGSGEEVGKTFLREEYLRRHGEPLKEGWIIMNHWVALDTEHDTFNVRPFVAMLCYDSIMIFSFSTAAILGYLTLYYINQTEAVSLHSHNLQLKLFIAMTAQTLVPFVFVYIPYLYAVNFPFFRLTLFLNDDVMMVFLAFFPALDAVIVILLIKDYRDGLFGMIGKKTIQPLKSEWKTTGVTVSRLPSIHPPTHINS